MLMHSMQGHARHASALGPELITKTRGHGRDTLDPELVYNWPGWVGPWLVSKVGAQGQDAWDPGLIAKVRAHGFVGHCCAEISRYPKYKRLVESQAKRVADFQNKKEQI